MSLEAESGAHVALHVLVVGFHHKRGMQIEHCYPAFTHEGREELPKLWHHLPSLCLPDGAHNNENDTVYFHLPHLTNPEKTVFGVACYRQIDAEKVTKKTEDITRNTVQKSVCVLTSLPIYGYVHERLQVTTKVYFNGADFSDVKDLEALFHDLNGTNWQDKLMHGICVSEVVRLFGRNILILFKLLLLEKRILIYHSVVAPIVKTVTSLLALLPETFPDGLCHAASLDNEADVELMENSFATSCKHNDEVDEIASEVPFSNESSSQSTTLCRDVIFAPKAESETLKIINVTSDELEMIEGTPDEDCQSSSSSLTTVTSRDSPTSYLQDAAEPTAAVSASTATPNPSPTDEEGKSTLTPHSEPSQCLESAAPSQAFMPTPPEKYAMFSSDECGLPLCLFSKGYLVHPYLPLQDLEVLSQSTTRAFLVGVSNTLFVHKRNLCDVLILLEDGKIEIADPTLKKQLSLSTEDLRFAESILRQVDAVSAGKTVTGSGYISQPDIFLDGIGWVGGEEWLRLQFRVYLLSMLRSSICPATSHEYESFNSSFVQSWQLTENYKTWASARPYSHFEELRPGHPHAGHLSISDMRIRLSQTFHTLDRGRRLNQTFSSTGTAVVKTKEVVGGAFSSAKGAFNSLWSSFMGVPPVTVPPADDVDEEVVPEGIIADEALTVTDCQLGEETTSK